MATKRKACVFLSHSSKDKSLARRIAEDLQKANIDVWLDKWKILVGDSVTQSIQRGLQEADFVAVLLTKHSVESGWVEKEWQTKVEVEATARKVAILPLKVDDCSIPILLKDKRFANFQGDYADGVKELIEAVKGHVSRHDLPQPVSAAQMPSVSADHQHAGIAEYLANTLKEDFTRQGPHEGEFGQSASSAEQGSWAAGGPDEVAVKPWYYLTYWGIRGLEIADPVWLSEIRDVIACGVQRRIGDRWVEVVLDRSKTYGTVPGEAEVFRVRSYRHTLRGANILSRLDAKHDIVYQVLSDLINKTLNIQNTDGGWPQCDRIFVESDLWASAYFIRFTSELMKSGMLDATSGYEALRRPVLDARHETIQYIVQQWRSSQWTYRGVSGAVTTPKLLVELAEVAELDAETSMSLRDQCLRQLTDGGRLVGEIEIDRFGIAEVQQLIRIGLALQLLENRQVLGLSDVIARLKRAILRLLHGKPSLGPEDASFALIFLKGEF